MVIASEETTNEGITVYKNPVPSGIAFTVNSAMGYDAYGTLPAASGLTGDLDETYTTSDYLTSTYNASPEYAQPVTQSSQIPGLVTWSKTLVLGSSPATYLYSVNIYDEYGRTIMNSIIYKVLVTLNNVVGFFFLSLIVIGSYSVSPEAVNPLSEKQIIIRQLIYGIVMSLFFSSISLLIGLIFRNKLSLNRGHLLRLFLIQFLVLAAVYTIICLFVYLK